MSHDVVDVVTSTVVVARNDRCTQCSGPMLYRVPKGTENVVSTFCGTFSCPAWLIEIPEPSK